VIEIHRLTPRFVERIWGVTKLSPYFPDSPSKIGEVWFTPGEAYPLLVKFIFTSERLSVQVHPDDAYAQQHEGSRGKTEMWHILDAQPGATIAIGFREEVPPDRLAQAIADGSIEDLLNWVPVAPGETYFTRAGIVHAIGAGVTLCEIQQNSDVTYRLHDYGRGRELHIAKSLDVLETGAYDGLREMPVACDHFVTEMLAIPAGETSRGAADGLLVALKGEGTIAGREFRPGEVWHVMADNGDLEVASSSGARLLRVTCGPGIGSANR
jgi:mannose-6-phosphate isomerase